MRKTCHDKTSRSELFINTIGQLCVREEDALTGYLLIDVPGEIDDDATSNEFVALVWFVKPTTWEYGVN